MRLLWLVVLGACTPAVDGPDPVEPEDPGSAPYSEEALSTLLSLASRGAEMVTAGTVLGTRSSGWNMGCPDLSDASTTSLVGPCVLDFDAEFTGRIDSSVPVADWETSDVTLTYGRAYWSSDEEQWWSTADGWSQWGGSWHGEVSTAPSWEMVVASSWGGELPRSVEVAGSVRWTCDASLSCAADEGSWLRWGEVGEVSLTGELAPLRYGVPTGGWVRLEGAHDLVLDLDDGQCGVAWTIDDTWEGCLAYPW